LIGFEKFFGIKQDTSKNDVHKSVILKNKVVFIFRDKKIFDLSADDTNNQILNTRIIM
jgi:hypothetical protein